MPEVFMLVSFFYIGAIMICAEITNPNLKRATFRYVGIFGATAMSAIFVVSIVSAPKHAAFFITASGVMIVVAVLRAFGILEKL